MRTRDTIVLTALVSSGAAAVAWFAAAPKTGAHASVSVPQSEITELRAEVAALRSERAKPTIVLQAATPSSVDPPAPPAREPAPRPPRAAPPTPEEVQAGATRDFDRYHQHFEAEARDNAWATDTERQVTAALSDPVLSKLRLEQFRCASSLCRLQAHAAGEQDFENFAQEFPKKTPSLPSGSFRKVDDGKGGLKVVGFFARPGATLPAE